MNGIRCFRPDLIVEVTTVCDRQCAGCYAPNNVSGKDPAQLLAEKPEWFLTTVALETTLRELHAESSIAESEISVRGGEPTRHPGLPDLLRSLRRSSSGPLYLETHGRWALTGSEHLFDVLRETDTIVKISFDQMHGLSPSALKQITESIEREDIRWCVAITEATSEEWAVSRKSCSWVNDDHIIVQRKAYSADALVRPTFGVIHVNGSRSDGVSTRPGFSRSAALDPGIGAVS